MEQENGAVGAKRRGMAMMLVLVMSVVILAMGMAMIGLSGDVLGGTVDTKTKIKARYAAETSISVAIADAVYQAGEIFGGGVSASSRNVAMGSDNGLAAVSSGNNLGQEVILQKRSPMNNLRGNKIPLKIEATGKSGSAKSRISASVALYQVPIYQFGVFYDGPLEITPGPNMDVMGRVHTNSDAYFRGIATLSFEGPVTVAGNIYQWWRSSAGHIKYRLKPDSILNLYDVPGLSTNLVKMTSSSQPPAIDGASNARYQETKLVLPIGVGTPHSILGVRDSSDPASLRRQKFDWLVLTRSSAAARFVYTGSEVPPTWITGPWVMYDRRERRWVRFWDFDVEALAGSGNLDSIFYLDDTLSYKEKIGTGSSKNVLNAFRIKKANVLPRNMTIACGKPVYIMGNFNTQDASGNTSNYKNAQIASDAVTVLSAQWPNYARTKIGTGGVTTANSSMEQAYGNASVNWADCSGCSGTPTVVPTGTGPTADVRINAAMITGNKPSSASCLAGATNEAGFEACYEGGWHNTLRFLEDWSGRTVTFLGSFVCLWGAQTAGLRTELTDPGVKVIGPSGGPYHYSPPVRVWGYDTRFNDLNNMPPGSPFLATAILTNWLERN
jgi:hypothetical protein